MTRLPPRVHPQIRLLLTDVGAVTGLLEKHGSPLNVVFPDVFRQNVAAFRDVLRRSTWDHRICFAHKANQSELFAEAASVEGIMVDVASPGEWAAALAAGMPPSELVVTGPKGTSFLELVVGTGAVVNVDNPWELEQIIRLAHSRGSPATLRSERIRILTRLSGFGGPSGRPSRFGTHVRDAEHLLARITAAIDVLDFLGPSFHLDSNAVQDRVHAIAGCLDVVEGAATAGLSPQVLDIGGGYGQVFLDDLDAFEEYVSALRRGLLGAGPPLTWDHALLGYRIEGGGLVGTPTFHRYANAVPGPDFLAAVLAAPLSEHGGRTVTDVLRDNLIGLWVEPGRALVDQAGITLSTVQFTTTASDGSTLVTLDLSRDKVCPADQEVMVDPVVIHRSPAPDTDPHASGVGVYFAGSLCLERDMVYQHMTFLPRLPRPGDVVAFVNTAAYQMDLSASSSLMQPLPAKVGYRSGDGLAVMEGMTPSGAEAR